MWLYLALGVLAVCILIKLYIIFSTAQCTSDADLTGKTVIITGATSGLGFDTALDLATRNARVIISARDMVKGQRTKDSIVAETGSQNIVLKYMDLSSLESVRKFAAEIRKEERKLDIFINNAGIFEPYYKETSDGLETTWAVNFFAPFLLTNLLLDLLESSSPSRIVNVASIGHRFHIGSFKIEDINKERKEGTNTGKEYLASKLALVMITREFHRRLEGSGVSVFSLHPGSIGSELFRSLPWWNPFCWCLTFAKWFFLKSGKDGAQTSIHCAVSENLERYSGEYFDSCKVAKPNKIALDEGLAKKLWEFAEKEVGLS